MSLKGKQNLKLERSKSMFASSYLSTVKWKGRCITSLLAVVVLSWIFGLHRIKIGYSPTFDFAVCDYLCGKSYMECFQRDYTLIVYKEHVTDNLTFHQMDHYNVRNKTLMDYLVMSQDSGRPDHDAGKKCYLKEIDSQYSTLKRQNKCAVIGNSGILLESQCGSTIDSYDLVIRANMAPVRGYESDVGNKTDLMLVNDVMLGNLDTILSSGPQTEREKEIWRTLRNLNNTILWYPKNTSKHKTLLQNIAKALKEKQLHIQVAFSLKDVYSNVKRKYHLWRYPSSGLYMLAVAEAVCQRTTIFGFYPYEKDDVGKKVLRHYYEKNLTNFKTWAHNFDAEYHMLMSRRDEGLIDMVTKPCVPTLHHST